jgi:hypothetical protein
MARRIERAAMAAKVGAEYRTMEEHRQRVQAEAELRRQAAARQRQQARSERHRLAEQLAEHRRAARREAWSQYDRSRRRTLKVKARRALQDALRRGKLKKADRCQGCGAMPPAAGLHGHHEDYRKPLVVRWLCVSCHVHAHGGQFGDATRRASR